MDRSTAGHEESNRAQADALGDVETDLARLERTAQALRALLDDVELGAAGPGDLLPVVELLSGFVLDALLPAWREVVAPHLHATGRLHGWPTPDGPGADAELAEALAALECATRHASSEAALTHGIRWVAGSLAARARRERALMAEAARRRTGFESEDAHLGPRLSHAFPDLAALRQRADNLLSCLESPWAELTD